ncbi:protein kinase subdomain-containing protein PKL/CAK/ACAD [Lentinula aciculospora]|uniref:Protein kinase subdomain-containing protein PKL/CAK/ACAD n=1 Tax=Lentinula aciculospora TaxID=153920 RepID=A0A9W9AIH1_9AGAR|nr:protein kinase subdomain-containing protein PKL/CAK/ACAD [Lentinula aciculospora]
MSSDDSKKEAQINGSGYGEIRASIDVGALEKYLEKNLKGVRLPVSVKQFKFGQSNPTYFLTDANKKRYVLRKKPSGQLLSKTAHQVEREYTVLHALHKYNLRSTTPASKCVPVPEPYLLCEDTSVIGTPFYVMEFLDGRIFEDARLLELSPKDREECWLASIHALSALSSVDPVDIGLESYGPPQAYFPRQLRAFTKIAEVQGATRDVDTNEPVQQIPYYVQMQRWFQSHLPDESKMGRRIVHGDYKLDNLVFHPTENRVIGILDWELSTLGSPLADFANLTQLWSIKPEYLPKEEIFRQNVRAFKDLPTNIVTGVGKGGESGAPVQLELLEKEYCRRMHVEYPLKDIVFVRSWTLFRTSIISQGIAARAARRQASSANAAQYSTSAELFGNLARKVVEDAEGGLTNREAKL